jgi:hypothetical protein
MARPESGGLEAGGDNPIPGNPGLLEDLARRLRRGRDTLRDTARHDPVPQRGERRALEQRCRRGVPHQRRRCAAGPRVRRGPVLGTSHHLGRYAEELEAAQRDAAQAQAAIERAKRTQQRAADEWDRLGRTDPDSDASATARRDLTAANETIGLMGRSLQQAIQRAEEAATRCATAIGATIQDPLRGVGPLYTPFANQVAGLCPRPVDMDLARLADGDYELGPPRIGDWRRLTPEEVAVIGLNPADLDNPSGSGLRAVVYESNGRSVLAFAGTDPFSGADLGADGSQAVGLPTEQYQQAARIADRANAAFGSNLAITGHSLVGGLAAYAALRTGRPAVTFNAAGLHDHTLRSTPGQFGAATPDEARKRAANGLVRGYHVKDEPVTSAQNGDGVDGRDDLPAAVGQQIELSEPSLGYKVANRQQFGGHGSATVIESMERDRPWSR